MPSTCFMRLSNCLMLLICLVACTQTNISKEAFKKHLFDEANYLNPAIDLMTKREFDKSIHLIDSLYYSKKDKTFFSPLQYYDKKKILYQNKGDEDGFLLYTDSAISFIEKHALEKPASEYYSGLLLSKSSILFNKHQPEIANALFFKVQEFSRENNTILSQYTIAEQLAYVAYQQKNYQQAVQSFKETWELQKQIQPYNDFYKAAQTINNIALSFDKFGNTDSAIAYYNMALQVIDTHQEHIAENATIASSLSTANKSKGVVYGNLAKIFYKKGLIDSAISLSKQSIAINTRGCCEQRDAQLVQMRLIDMYADKKRYDSMFLQLQDLRQALDTMPSTQPELNYQRQMATYYEMANAPQKAYQYFKRYVAMNDSLKALELKDAESDIVKDLQIKKQEADLGLLKKNNQLSTLYLYITIGLIGASFIIIALVYVNFKKSRKANIALMLLNQQVSEQKVELEQANKDKDRILRIVAHDLRNPISGIAALSKTVIDAGVADAKQAKYLQLIEKTANSSLGLINELLQANALVSATNFQDVNLNQLLQHSVTLTQHQAQAKQQLIALELPDSNIILPLVFENFERVMVNLITNAIKFSPVNTTITVALQQADNFATITVSDIGIGIPAQHINEVFTALPSIKRIGTAGEKSFGLGLSICKQIVEAHKGKIWVESEEGKGAKFYIQLPLTRNV